MSPFIVLNQYLEKAFPVDSYELGNNVPCHNKILKVTDRLLLLRIGLVMVLDNGA